MNEITIDEAIEQIGLEIGKVKVVAQAGLLEAALKIINASMKKVPILYGNLRASAYVRTAQETTRPDSAHLDEKENEPVPTDRLGEIGVELGYTANYAVYVHENLEAFHDDGEAKFLESVIIENADLIVEIVKQRSGGE